MIIGICGGTGAGKTTVARRILENVNDEYVTYLQQDSYYRNLGDLPVELRHQINFDNEVGIDLISGKIRAQLQKEINTVPYQKNLEPQKQRRID